MYLCLHYIDWYHSTGEIIILVLGEGRFNIEYIQYAKKNVAISTLTQGKYRIDANTIYILRRVVLLWLVFLLHVLIFLTNIHAPKHFWITLLSSLLTMDVYDECYLIIRLFTTLSHARTHAYNWSMTCCIFNWSLNVYAQIFKGYLTKMYLLRIFWWHRWAGYNLLSSINHVLL